MGESKKKYEDVLDELERLVEEIEKPERSLDAIASDVKKAAGLVAWCREYIKGSREKMDELLGE